MPTAIRSWQLRSSSAHCDQKLAKRIGEKLGDEDWRGSWRRGLARRRKRRRRRRTAVIKSNNPHLRGGEKSLSFCALGLMKSCWFDHRNGRNSLASQPIKDAISPSWISGCFAMFAQWIFEMLLQRNIYIYNIYLYIYIYLVRGQPCLTLLAACVC